MCFLADEAINSFVIPEYPTRGDENLIARAASLVASAVEIEPGSQRLISVRANLLRAQGHWAEAVPIFQHLIELYPNTHWALSPLWFPQVGYRSGRRGGSLTAKVHPS